MRKRSPQTENRALRRQLKSSEASVEQYRLQARIAEGKLTQAKQETSEWKRRFDALLGIGAGGG